ncbi:MAG: DUF2934 domain-containing protein [Chlorobiaceae bacterium]|nr:DUF2934 domain-containing protein [Chlorobiaceae bacterium]NTV16854.1 DUF2934 domain-containing protein [Chlorobiaceae bacterium]
MPHKSKKKVKPSGIDELQTPDDREEAIRLSAYYRWKKRGEKHGEDREDWLEAEDALDDSFADSHDD